MTAECTGGTSAPRAGLAEFVTVASGAIALAMTRYGAARLQFLIPLLGLPPFELAALCATDPPALPTFTEAEVFSMLRIGLDADYFSGIGKARDLVTRMLWYDLCECTSGTLIPFVEPTLPTATPEPVLPAPQVGSPCYAATFTNHILAGAADQFEVLPSLLGSGASMVRVTFASTPHTAAQASTLTMDQILTTGAQSQLLTATVSNAVQGPLVLQAVLPFNIDHLYFYLHSAGNAGITYDMVSTVEVFCGGQSPDFVQQPCCPPDEATQSYLDLILNMVTLIQRQSAPFSYVYGANHTALSGHGSFAVSGLIGASVDVTTLPTSYGETDGSPVRHFDLGFITLGTADGYDVSRRIDHDGSLVIPPHAGVFTSIGYTLSPGVVVSIRELVREP